ncbi:UNVERIFIED_CONTAM: hypothetical protein GTU68_063838 [Idotea baltica]|nr:hypothetical protein [Idotea baltica]
MKEEMRLDVLKLIEKGQRPPHLAAILIGDNPASQSYVRNKTKSCDEVGFKSTLIKRPADITESELLDIVRKCNEDDELDGFIVQLPLPPHINEQTINLAIDHRKDVDGFHPVNFGRMVQGLPAYLPATPYGILILMERYGVETEGKNCVVLGRSNIVGTPMTILLSRKASPGNATVTLAHSRTKNLNKVLAQADIIIAAIGKPHFVTLDMIKPGAVVVDVGINKIVVGDVDFDGVADRCSHITPVPGGVGPMTVMGLLTNTLKSYNKEIYY